MSAPHVALAVFAVLSFVVPLWYVCEALNES